MNRQTQSLNPNDYKKAVAAFIGIPLEKLPDGVEINIKNAIAFIKKGQRIVISKNLATARTVKNICTNVRSYKGYELHVEYQDNQSIVTRL